MQIDWFTFVAQIINFLILIWLLHRFLYKPVIKAMDEREQRIASELEEARLKKVEAEQIEHDFRQKVKNIEAQKEQLLEEAKKEAIEKRSELMGEIREEVTSIKKHWEEAVESEKEAFLAQLKQETGNRLVSLINNILIDLTDRNLQEQAINIFFDRLRTMDPGNRARMQEALTQLKTQQAEVYSSFELNGQQKHQLADLMRTISEADLNFEFKEKEGLGPGLEVRIGGWSIAWNLKRYLETLHSDMVVFFDNHSPADKMTELK